MKKLKRTQYPVSLRKVLWEMSEDSGDWEDFPIEKMGQATIDAGWRKLAEMHADRRAGPQWSKK